MTTNEKREQKSPLAKVIELGIGRPNIQKRRRSSGVPRLLSATTTRPCNKQRIVPQLGHGMPNGRHYTAPIGMRWSENSCAYDSVFTPIYVQWCANRDLQTDFIRRTGSPEANLLIDGFIKFEAGQGSLEGARDAVRRYMARSPNGTPFGAYTSIWEVLSGLLRTNEIVLEKFYLCPMGHNVCHSNESYALLSAGATPFTCMAQWISTNTEQTTARCSVCRHQVSVRLKFCNTPPVMAFEFSAQPTVDIVHLLSVQLENHIQNYSLAAVIYYSQDHFTTQIVTRDGRVWFYDGMSIANPTVEPILHSVGSINDPLFSIQDCRGRMPCAALYTIQM